MQFLRNQLSDFKNSWSCLILTFLRIEQCTMHSPHLNCAATLPCKTLTMKITIFVVMLVLKSEENIACYQFKTLRKQFISRRAQNVRPQLSHKLEVSWRCSVWPCWQSSVADRSMWTARLSSAHRWYLAWVEMSCSVEAQRHRYDSQEGWGPVSSVAIFSDEVTAVGDNPVLSQLCHVSRRSVLLEYETTWQTILAIFDQFG